MSRESRILPLDGYKPTACLPEGVATVQINPNVKCPFNQGHDIWQSNKRYTCPACRIYWSR